LKQDLTWFNTESKGDRDTYLWICTIHSAWQNYGKKRHIVTFYLW